MIFGKLKKVLFIALSLVIVASTALAVAFLGTKNSTVVSADDVTFAMVDGAALRFSDEGGIRFRVKMNSATKTTVMGADYELYFVIAPTSLYNKVTDGKYAEMTKKISIKVDKTKIYEESGYFYAQGCVVNINEANRNLSYSAIAYYTNGTTNTYATTNNLTRGTLYNLLNQAMFASTDYSEDIFNCTAYNTWFSTEKYPIRVESSAQYDKVVNKVNEGVLPETVSVNAGSNKPTVALASGKVINSSYNIAPLASFIGTAASSQYYYGIDKLNDGNKYTGMKYSGELYGQMNGTFDVVIDFGAVSKWNNIYAHGIKAAGGINAPKSVAIYYSNDNSNWSKTSDLKISTTDTNFIAENVYVNESRYIKLTFTAQTWCLLDEIEVSGVLEVSTENIASFAKVTEYTSSGYGASYNRVAELFDGKKVSSAWSGYANNADSYLVIDLGVTTAINGFSIHGLLDPSGVREPASLIYSYSNDNAAWGTLSVITTKEVSSTDYTYEMLLPTIYARYLKINIAKNIAFSFDEIEIFGKTFNITFEDKDGNVISESKVLAGVTPVCEVGLASTKSGWINVITGWDKEIVPATEDATYVATIEEFKTARTTAFNDITYPSVYSGGFAIGSKAMFTDGLTYSGIKSWENNTDQLGQQGQGKEFVFDFGETTSWNEIKVHFGISWVFHLPAKIAVSISNNNVSWTSVGTLDIGKLNGATDTNWCEKLFNAISSRYIKLTIDAITESGNNYFLIDEVEIYKATNDKKITGITATTTTTDFAYAKNSPNVLFDGKVSNPDNIPDWGYSGVVFANNKTTEVIIDLGATYKVNGLWLHGICASAGVRVPKSLKLEYSNDGETYSTATVSGNYYNESTGAKLESWDAPNMTYYSKLTVSSFTGRYVKLTIENTGGFSLDEVEFYGEKTVSLYSVTFQNPNGVALQNVNVKEGEIPVYTSATPTLESKKKI